MPDRWLAFCFQIETIYLGDRKLSVRTSVLEEKATACNMLCCYADELKEGFYPFVEQVSQPPLHTACIDEGGNHKNLKIILHILFLPIRQTGCRCRRAANAAAVDVFWVPACTLLMQINQRASAVLACDRVHLGQRVIECGVVQVTGIMLPLLKFYFHEEVRQAAVQSLPDLLRSAFLAAQKGLPGADADYVRRMVDFIWAPLMEAMAKVRRRPQLPTHMHLPDPQRSLLPRTRPLSRICHGFSRPGLSFVTVVDDQQLGQLSCSCDCPLP